MGITRKYTVDRITSGKVVLLDRADESVQIVLSVKDFASVNEGDIVQVTWTSGIGGASYCIKQKDETVTARKRIQDKLKHLKEK